MELNFTRNLANWDRVMRLTLAAIFFIIPTVLTLGVIWTAVLYILAVINIIEAVLGY